MADVGGIHAICFYKHGKCKSYEGHSDFQQDIRRKLGRPGSISVPTCSSWQGNVMRVKRKLQWRFQKDRSASIVQHLPRETEGGRQSQCQRKTLWYVTSKAVEVALSKPLEAYILPPCATGAGYGDLGFENCPADFWYDPGLIPSFMLTNFSLLEYKCLSHVCPTVVSWKYVTFFFFFFLKGFIYEFVLSHGGQSGFGILGNTGAVKIWGTIDNGINAFCIVR